jgi:drug/metabolite transporter (DMT)-like permease
VVFIVAAGALIAWTSVIAKALGTGWGGDELHPVTITAGRFCFAFLALTVALAARWPGFEGTAWSTHCLRVAAGVSGATLLFAAASAIPLPDANAISFLSPAITMVLAVVVLGERAGRRAAPALVAFAGALILTRPGSDTFRPEALLALAAAVALGAEMLFIKKLADTEPPLRILAISNGFGSILSLTAALVVADVPAVGQLVALAVLGVSMLAAQVLFIAALQRSDASAVAPFLYLVPLYAAGYDWLLFAEVPDTISVIGVAVIIVGAAWLARREQ